MNDPKALDLLRTVKFGVFSPATAALTEKGLHDEVAAIADTIACIKEAIRLLEADEAAGDT